MKIVREGKKDLEIKFPNRRDILGLAGILIAAPVIYDGRRRSKDGKKAYKELSEDYGLNERPYSSDLEEARSKQNAGNLETTTGITILAGALGWLLGARAERKNQNSKKNAYTEKPKDRRDFT